MPYKVVRPGSNRCRKIGDDKKEIQCGYSKIFQEFRIVIELLVIDF
jgi:hypothetical protein